MLSYIIRNIAARRLHRTQTPLCWSPRDQWTPPSRGQTKAANKEMEEGTMAEQIPMSSHDYSQLIVM